MKAVSWHQILAVAAVTANVAVSTATEVASECSVLVIYLLTIVASAVLAVLAASVVCVSPTDDPFIQLDEHTVIAGQQFFCNVCKATNCSKLVTPGSLPPVLLIEYWK